MKKKYICIHCGKEMERIIQQRDVSPLGCEIRYETYKEKQKERGNSRLNYKNTEEIIGSNSCRSFGQRLSEGFRMIKSGEK